MFSRSLNTDASARYLLRHAAHLARDGHPMTLFLVGAAAGADGIASARACGITDVFLMKDEELTSRIEEEVGETGAMTGHLSALMLCPGMQIYWC